MMPLLRVGPLVLALLGVANADTGAGDAARGRRLFVTGHGAAGMIVAAIGTSSITVPATAVPCASCHGRDGRGRVENGIAPPDITWQALTKPARGDAAAERSRDAYSDALVLRAVTMGIDASGNRLDPVMPRFALPLPDAADLLAYLRLVGELPDPGLGAQTLVVGTVARAGDAAVPALLAAYFDAVNRRGGLFGRRLSLQVAEPREDETPGQALARLAAAGGSFALLAPRIAGDEATAVAAVEAEGLPTIGPLTPRVQAAPRSRYVFYLNGGVEAEGRALASFAATTLRRGNATVAVVADASPLSQAAAQAATAELGDSQPDAAILPPDSPRVASLLRNGGPVLWFADSLLARAAVRGLAGTPPTLLLPSEVAADFLAGGAPVPTYLAFTAGPADIAPDAAAELLGLSPGPGLRPQDRAAARQALAAAKLLVTALQRAGHEVTRERLVDALEAVQSFRSGLLPPVSFAASRHIGSTGVWIVPLGGGPAVWWDK
jgi:ABC-type branched-subunit amino acid transport system substrate-binding protein